jgi:hypothetical protein
MARIQTGQTLLFETSFPACDRWPRGMQFQRDLAPGLTFGQSQHQTSAEDVAGGKYSRLRETQ